MSDQAQWFIEQLYKTGKGPETRAMIMAFKNGQEFVGNACYHDFRDKPRPSYQDMYVIWSEFRGLDELRV